MTLKITSANPVDPDNPVPEASMRWRRWVTIFWALINSAGVWLIIHKLIEAEALKTVALALLALNALLILCYFVGASANDLTHIIQSASVIKGRVSLQTPGGTQFQRGQAAASADPEPVAEEPPMGPRPSMD